MKLIFYTINSYYLLTQMIKNFNTLIFIVLLAIFTLKVNTWCLKSEFADTQKINSIDFSRDGTKFVITSNSNKVTVYDAFNLEVLHIQDFTVNARIARFSKDGSMIAIGGQTDAIKVLRTSDYNIVATISTSQNWVNDLDFSDSGISFISCGNTNRFKLWSISGTSFTLQDTSSDHSQWILSCRFSRKWSKIAFAGKNGDVYTYSYSNTNLWNDRRCDIHSSSQRRVVSWNHLKNEIVAGGLDKNQEFFSSNPDSRVRYSIGKEIDTLAVADDGTFTAFGGEGGLLYIWTLWPKTGSVNEAFEISFDQSSGARLTAVAISPNSQFIIAGNDKGLGYVYKRICNGCPSGTYTNGTECRVCNTQIPGCFLCVNSTHCLGCSNGYYLDTSSSSTNLCKPCYFIQTGWTGCNQCSSNSVCISCVQGYYLDTGTKKCKTCWGSLKGCSMCSDANTCQQCDFRYYLNTTSFQCISCTNITNCLSCNSSAFCFECVQGYYENGSGGCSQCFKYCTNCINGSYCTQCDNSFYLSAGVCAFCTVNGCLSCNSSNYCFDCVQSMYENSGSCSFCTTPCLQCSGSATNCDSCIVGYYLQGAICKTCFGIAQGCVGCKGGGATDCTACATGYYLNGNICSFCTNIKANCAQCNSTACTTCRLGFWYDSANAICKVCSPGCLTCTDAGVCFTCIVGYYHTLASLACTQCPVQCGACSSGTVCSSCNPRYYYNSTNSNCTKCSMTNCVICKDQSTCLSCIEGFYPDSSGTICRSCSQITNCLDCSNQTFCKVCTLGFYLTASNATCAQCVHPCSTCDSNNCFTCQLGYYLTTSAPKVCNPCPKQCVQCVSLTNCSQCVPSYYHDSANNQCISCQNVKTGCLNCNSTVCYTCKVELGYYHNASDNVCYSCPSKITNCVNCLNTTNCILCKYEYLPTSTNTTCTKCSSLIPNCEHCLNGVDCKTCLKGFYADANGDCQQCSQGCSSCNTSANCQVCLREYILQPNFSCKLCEDAIAGCEMCNYNPTIQCKNCITGYYLVGTNCNLCSIPLQGCSICRDATSCHSCLSGYYHSPLNRCFLCSSNRPNCQLCDYNSGTSSVDCLNCYQGFFLNSTFECQTCTDLGCLSCSNSTTCTRCQTGFYLFSEDCLKCEILFLGCRLCNTTACLQCASGFYLNGFNVCQACSLQGCQICSQVNPATKCLACNSQYYLATSQLCQLCKIPIPNCLQCANSLTCQQCESGYFISATNNCDLCSSRFVGCSLCDASVCLECQSGHLLDSATDTCKLCTEFMAGCSFCLSQSNCLSCQSGFFPDANVCKRCNTITGCLECKDSTHCIFCDYGYFLMNDSCHSCNQTIPNCVACASSVICTACLGNYILSASSCNQLKGQSYPNYTSIKLITEYVSQKQLKHTLQSIGKKIVQVDLNWKQESKLYILDNNYTEFPLKITKYQFGPQGYSLIFYTDNPLGSMDQMNEMPILSNTRRLLAQFNLNTKMKTKIQMTEEGVNTLFPDIHHSGTFYMKYKLSEPEFYRSIVSTKTYYYEYFGFILSVILVVLYFSKSLFIVPDAFDKGEIIPHILCFKMMSFIIYPLYGEYINYCKGFILLDFPWFNQMFSLLMTIDSDKAPEQFKIFYNNLNLPSTYLFALLMIVTLYIIGYIIINCVIRSKSSWINYKGFLYNLFICGITVGSFLALQGAYFNPVSSISLNSLFYIFSISLFVVIVLQAIYSIYKDVNRTVETVIPFHKVRIVIKCVGLSLAYANPLYIFMSLIFLDLCLIVIEYLLKRQKKVAPKIWLFNNIFIDAGLSIMMLGPYSLLSVFIASGCIIIAIGIDVFIMIKELAEFKEINKVKLKQNELIKAMEIIEKESWSSRSKNHEIYFKNKVLEDLASSESNNILEQSNGPNPTMNLSQTLFFEQNEQSQNNFKTIPIAQQAKESIEQNQQALPEMIPSKKRAIKSQHLRRRQPEKKGWSLQEDENQGTFILGNFQ